MFIVLLSIAFTLWLMAEQWRMRRIMKLSGLRGSRHRALPLLGHAYLLLGSDTDRMKMLETVGNEAIENGGVVAAWFGRSFYTVTSDAVVAEIVLKSCVAKTEVENILRQLCGNGTVSAPVNIWRSRRKLIAPMFSTKHLRNFVEIFSRNSVSLVERLRPTAGRGAFSISRYLATYTMESVCETVLGENNHRDRSAFLSAFEEYCRIAVTRMSNPLLAIEAVYKLHPTYADYYASIKFMWKFIDEIITNKRLLGKTAGDDLYSNVDIKHPRSFIELLMAASSESGPTDVELREEMLVLALAGSDTTAVATSFICCLLARHPEVQERLYNELLKEIGESKRSALVEDLPKLKYMEAVIKESLRLYPPVPSIVRKIHKDITLPSGVTLIEGSGVFINSWCLHRNPRYWGPDATTFNPDRFLNNISHYPNAFIPFGSGSRNCIGYRYAMMSIKSVIAELVRNYKFLPPPSPGDLSKPLSVKFDIMLRDVGGFKVQLEARRT